MANTTDTYIAGNKFGLGLRPGEAGNVASDPRGWLLEQIETIQEVPDRLSGLPATSEFLEMFTDNRMDMQRMRQESSDEKDLQKAFRESRRAMAQDYQDHVLARLQVSIESDIPFSERLVHFWSNHFTVAASPGPKDIIRQIALPYEQEAIRSNLSKDFASLMLAVEQHPAMLVYLDNVTSFGPNSFIGKRRDVGLNENLAREIMELHTLGVDGGYSQDDVTSLARIITGWTMDEPRFDRLPGARTDDTTGFLFVSQLHEPGTHSLLDKSYGNSGIAQGENAMKDLALHPATAKHIATKLARNFVSDEPPQSAVATLEKVFLDTEGNLPSLHEALVNLDEAWDPANRKLKTPQDLIVSTGRALELGPVIERENRVSGMLARILGTFNQMPFTALSPAGWDDSAVYWGGPDALMKRMEWANTVANLNAGRFDARSLAEEILPPDAALSETLARAESDHQATTLLLAAPAFQWRS